MRVLNRSTQAVIFAISFFSSLTTHAFSYPTGPDTQITPGSLCAKPVERRYHEQIYYCGRKVGSSLKQEVIKTYVDNFGYNITKENRSAFKIDHFIPLCVGGSNEADNLWPQHKDVYTITDKIENIACIKMMSGYLKQAKAVELIRRAKLNLAEAPMIQKHIENLTESDRN